MDRDRSIVPAPGAQFVAEGETFLTLLGQIGRYANDEFSSDLYPLKELKFGGKRAALY